MSPRITQLTTKSQKAANEINIWTHTTSATKIRQKGLLKTIGTQIDGWNEAHDIKSGQME